MKKIMDSLKKLYKDGFLEDSHAFMEHFFSTVKKRNILTHFQDGELVSSGYIIDKSGFLFGKKTNIPYLSALSTLTHMRGMGMLENIMRTAFYRLYSRGEILCVLHPFEYNYYKRFGFDNISYKTDCVITGGTDYDIRFFKSEDIDSLMGIYRQFTSGYENHIYKGRRQIKSLLKEYACDNIQCQIVSDNNVDFAFYFDCGNDLDYCVFSDKEKLKKCESLIGRRFCDLTGFSEPYNQCRIINAKKALNRYVEYLNYSEPCHDLSHIINKSFAIKDEMLAQNNICFKIERYKNDFRLQKASSPEKIIDISTLANLIFSSNGNLEAKKCLFIDKY